MKKSIAGLLLAAGLCLMLAGCQGEAIALPLAGEVEAIQGENLAGEPVALTEAEEIAAVMESVQDAPLTEPYGSLTLENQGGETLLYYYEERGATLVEQPYTGIFRLEGSLEDLLAQLA